MRITAGECLFYMTIAILDGSASPEQLEEHEKLLQDDEYRKRFEELEPIHRLVDEALPEALHGEKYDEGRPLPDETMDTLIDGVRERFAVEELGSEKQAERKVVPFTKYFLPLAAAAAASWMWRTRRQTRTVSTKIKVKTVSQHQVLDFCQLNLDFFLKHGLVCCPCFKKKSRFSWQKSST